MNKVAKYPPPEVRRLVTEALPDLPHNALWPSHEDITIKNRKLGRELVKLAAGQPLKDIYPILGVASRGGLDMANYIGRVFDYGNPDIRFIGVSSYGESGTEQTEEFIRGQIPDIGDIEGRSILLFDEVCDTGNTLVENVRIMNDELHAAQVLTAVLDYKPALSKTKFVPDVYVDITDKWIVYPWEVYEILKEKALDENIWLPPSIS